VRRASQGVLCDILKLAASLQFIKILNLQPMKNPQKIQHVIPQKKSKKKAPLLRGFFTV